MSARHVVVDGSNIATEGRSLPSLAQLEEAVREYSREFPDDVITVVVDATFGHRIDESERATYDEAVAHNEVVCPPAGAIGRGDAFLLRVADKVGATVLSNDSFQEFHGEHEWLFNNGRLIGGKPVPGVGWVFTARTPVRGPKSREAVRAVKKGARKARPEEKQEKQKVQKAIAVATEEAVEPDSPKVKRRRRSRGGAPPAEPVNEPLPFIEFVAGHPLGSEVEGEVETFSSHGAFVTVDSARCYVPLSAMGSPPPRAAKDVLRKGERRSFVVQAFDPPRRGIELALPEFAHVSGEPTPETVEDEIREGAARRAPAARAPRSRRARAPAEVGPEADGEQVASVVGAGGTDGAGLDGRARGARRVRVYELARELGRTNREIVDLCRSAGVDVASHSASVADAEAERVRREVRGGGVEARAAEPAADGSPATGRPSRRRPPRKAAAEAPAPESATPGGKDEAAQKKAAPARRPAAKTAKTAKTAKVAKAAKTAKVAKSKKAVGSV